MPYDDDENHSPSEFYYPEQTNDPKNTAERLAVKAFFGLLQSHNKLQSNKALAPSSLDLYEKPKAILSRTDLPLG